MKEYRTKLESNGRLLVPIGIRKKLNLEAGEEFIIMIFDNEIRIKTLDQSVSEAQAEVKKYTKNKKLTAMLKEMRLEDFKNE